MSTTVNAYNSAASAGVLQSSGTLSSCNGDVGASESDAKRCAVLVEVNSLVDA